MTAPNLADVLGQQDRADNAQALGDKALIDREASRQTLPKPTAPAQRTDTSGDMFALEKAQAPIDNRNRTGTNASKFTLATGTNAIFSQKGINNQPPNTFLPGIGASKPLFSCP